MDDLKIKYFKTVAHTLNISQAAKSLYISQSSLSQTISHLEKELGYQLFERNGRRISLNENGRIFLEFVNEVEQEYKNMLTHLAEVNSQYVYTVKIQVQCASLYLPPLIEYLKIQLPEVLFLISQWNHDIPFEGGEDICICASTELLNDNTSELLLKENILLALPQGHPLLLKRDIYLKDLTNEKFISLNDSWLLEKMIKEECVARSVQLTTAIQVDNPDILRRLLCMNLGLAFIPEKTWGSEFAKGTIELRQVKDFAINRYVYLKWKKGYLSQNVQKSIGFMKKFFKN